MIRRQANGTYLLIAQHEHALLAGKLARHVGNTLFAMPVPYEPCLQGITLHDSGWPMQDEQPALNADHLPMHVFETPVEISLRVWDASVTKAARYHPYSGLLVSIHVMGLSRYSMQVHTTPQEVFKLNSFQLRQSERQVDFRQQLQMRTNIPLCFGLAKPGTDPNEDQLSYNLQLLQLMDQLSLALCCSEKLFPKIEGIRPKPASQSITMTLDKPTSNTLHVDPWPFDTDRLEFQVPCRSIPAGIYTDENDYHRAYQQAIIQTLQMSIRH